MNFKVFLILAFCVLAVLSGKLQKCKSGSLSKLNLLDLIKKSTVSEDCLEECRKEFEKRFSNAMITIGGPLYEDADIESNENADKDDDSDDDDVEEKRSITDIKNLLRNFGDLINAIFFDFEEISEDHGKKLIQILNKKSASTLKVLHLQNLHGNILNKLKNQFKKVVELGYSSSPNHASLDVPADEQKFSTIFPNIIALVTANMTATDFEFLYGKFAQLKLLRVGSDAQAGVNEEEFESKFIKFLRINRHIQALVVDGINLKLLSEVDKYCSDLQEIRLGGLSENYSNFDGEVKFESLKAFALAAFSENDLPNGIDLHQIEALELSLPFEFSKQWWELLKNQVNKNLLSFTLAARSITPKQLLAIYKRFPALISTFVTASSEFEADDIDAIVDKAEALVEMQMIVQIKKTELRKLNKLLAGKGTLKYKTIPSKELKNLAFIYFRKGQVEESSDDEDAFEAEAEAELSSDDDAAQNGTHIESSDDDTQDSSDDEDTVKPGAQVEIQNELEAEARIRIQSFKSNVAGQFGHNLKRVVL